MLAGILPVTAGVAIAAQPACRANFVGLPRGPDVGAAEVGTVGIGIANRVHDRQVTGIPDLLERSRGRMHTPLIVELYRGVSPNRNARPGAVIVVIAIGNNRIESIVAACQLHN